MDFHEILYEGYSTVGQYNFVILKFLQLVILTWQMKFPKLLHGMILCDDVITPDPQQQQMMSSLIITSLAIKHTITQEWPYVNSWNLAWILSHERVFQPHMLLLPTVSNTNMINAETCEVRGWFSWWTNCSSIST